MVALRFQFRSRMWTAQEINIAGFLRGLGPDDVDP
jgi:hypothetical protein